MAARRWEKLDGGTADAELAFSHELPIGMVGKAADGWFWKITAVFMKDIGRRGTGRALKSRSSARAAVQRGWAAWRRAAGLATISKSASHCDRHD